MYNLRYHIASLVAIFLSLTIGLLLGTIVSERGTLDDQRDALTQGLREDFEALSEENSELSEQTALDEEFIDDVTPLLVEGELAGRRVLLLANAGRVNGQNAVEDAVLAAGGTLSLVRFTTPRLAFDGPEVSSATTGVVAPEDGVAPTADEVLDALVREWTVAGVSHPLTDALVGADVLSVSEFPSDATIDAVVVISSWDGEPDELALRIATEMHDLGLPAVGVETAGMPTGVAAAALEQGFSAIDDMGGSRSTYSLVFVLSGRATGAFGTGEAATDPYPRVEPVR
jgi:hypothetical protein